MIQSDPAHDAVFQDSIGTKFSLYQSRIGAKVGAYSAKKPFSPGVGNAGNVYTFD